MPKYLPLLVYLASGCSAKAPIAQTIVSNQAAFDFDCPIGEVLVRPIGNKRYTAEGCFKRDIYQCNEGVFTSDGNVACTQQITSLPEVLPAP
jgi:hypothetical protein